MHESVNLHWSESQCVRLAGYGEEWISGSDDSSEDGVEDEHGREVDEGDYGDDDHNHEQDGVNIENQNERDLDGTDGEEDEEDDSDAAADDDDDDESRHERDLDDTEDDGGEDNVEEDADRDVVGIENPCERDLFENSSDDDDSGDEDVGTHELGGNTSQEANGSQDRMGICLEALRGVQDKSEASDAGKKGINRGDDGRGGDHALLVEPEGVFVGRKFSVLGNACRTWDSAINEVMRSLRAAGHTCIKRHDKKKASQGAVRKVTNLRSDGITDASNIRRLSVVLRQRAQHSIMCVFKDTFHPLARFQLMSAREAKRTGRENRLWYVWVECRHGGKPVRRRVNPPPVRRRRSSSKKVRHGGLETRCVTEYRRPCSLLNHKSCGGLSRRAPSFARYKLGANESLSL